MIDPNAVIQGAISSIAMDKVRQPIEKTVDDTLGLTPVRTHEDYLHEIHLVLVELLAFLKNTQAVTGDNFRWVTINKVGFGPPFIPNHSSGRQHFRIFQGTSFLLNCSGTPAGQFNVTTKAGDWTVIDFPDGNQYYLDASVVPNAVLFWLQETNSNVI